MYYLQKTYCSIPILMLAIIILAKADALAQNIPSVVEVDAKETQSTSDISFETQDTLETPKTSRDYNPMPIPTVRESEESEKKVVNGDQWVRYDIDSKKTEKLEIKPIPQEHPSSIREGYPGIYPLKESPENNEAIEYPKKTDNDPDKIQKFSSLQQVANPTDTPYRMNVRLAMTFPNGRTSMCSGSLVDYEWVMTAGHCIYKDERGGWVTDITVVPAFENDNEPFGNSKGAQLYSLKGWTEDESYNYDIGWIRLKRPVGYLTGWFSFGYDNDDSFFKNSTFHNPGYPGEPPYDSKIMYKWSGSYDFKFFKSETYQVGQDRVGFGGQSGSGAYAFKNNKRVQYAVLSHTLEDKNENRKPPTDYTRIRKELFNHLEDLIADERDNSLDLTALNVDALPETPVEGTTLESLKFHVANRTSDQQGGTWNFDIYLSDNKDISTADQLVSTQSFTHTFQPNQLLRVNATPPTIPIGTEGKKYIGVILKESDLKTSNNDSDGWDAAEVDIIPSREVTIKSENPDSDVPIRIEPSDIYGREDGLSELKRRYPDDTQLELSAPLTIHTEKFSGWYKEGRSTPITRDINYSAGARYRDRTIVIKYATPDIPVLPHSMGEIMPSYHSETKTQELKIINKHSYRIYWDINTLNNSEWLSVDRTSGTTYPGETDVIEVIFDSSNMDTGDFEETLRISTDVVSLTSSMVPVRLRVGHMPGTIPTPDEIYQAHNPIPGDLYGQSIGSDLLGDLISFGMPGLNERTGGLAMYELTEGGELGEETLITPGESFAGNLFGHSQALLNNERAGILAIGAPGNLESRYKIKNSTQTSHTGQVHIYQKDGEEWKQQQVLQPDVSGEEVRYGDEVAIASIPDSDGEYILAVGAPGLGYEDRTNVGAVFLYRIRNGEMLTQNIIWPDQITSSGGFGSSIDFEVINGRPFIAIGAPGNAAEEIPGTFEIHNFNGENWQFLQSAESVDETRDGLFGASLALTSHDDELLIAVGSPNYGKVGGVFFYNYLQDEKTLVEAGSILEGPEIEKAELGRTVEFVSMPRYTVLMTGAPGTNVEDYGGSAWLYQLNTGSDTWRFRSKLEPRKEGGNVNMGMGMAMAPVMVKDKLHYITSAPGTEVDGANEAGAVYRFDPLDPLSLPGISVSRNEISENLKQGTQKQIDFSIQSSGKAELVWSLSETASWISTDINEGTIPAGENQNLQIELDAAGLDAGQYNSDLILTSNDISQDTILVPVHLAVSKRMDIDLMVLEASITRGDTLESGELFGAGSAAWVTNNSIDSIDTQVSLKLYLSPDSLINKEDSLIASVRIDTSLQIEEQLQIDFPVATQIPFGHPTGRTYLGIKVDHNGDYREVDTTNNVLILPLWILEARTPQFTMADQYRRLQVEIDEEIKSMPLIVQNSGIKNLEFSVPGFGEESAAKTKPGNSDVVAQEDSIPAYLVDVVPATGDIAPGDSAELTLTMDGSKVQDGYYQDTLSLLTNDPANSSIDIPLEITVSGGTYIEVGPEIPREYAMDANYPNPFNPSTTIAFALPEDSPVRLEVFNLLGRRVSTLVNKDLQAGYYNIQFDAHGWSSGIYIYRIQAGSYTKTRKMLLLK